MILYKRTDVNSRVVIRATWRGIVTSWERPRVGGGWYPDNTITASWPWTSLR